MKINNKIKAESKDGLYEGTWWVDEDGTLYYVPIQEPGCLENIVYKDYVWITDIDFPLKQVDVEITVKEL